MAQRRIDASGVRRMCTRVQALRAHQDVGVWQSAAPAGVLFLSRSRHCSRSRKQEKRSLS